MSKFNQPTQMVNTIERPLTRNHEGALAFQLKGRELLLSEVLTSFFESEAGFYKKKSSDIQRTIREVLAIDPKFVAKLAIYARKEFHLRSIAHVLVAELAYAVKGEVYVKNAVARVCERPDDMKEILAYYLTIFGKPIPNSLKKGLAVAMLSFDGYQLAKYNQSGQVSLKDILKLTHPSANSSEQSEVFNKILAGTLETAKTWQNTVNQEGNNSETWETLINEGKIGYMALMRNLRNILNANVSSDTLQKVCDQLVNEQAVLRSKQLPFRFYTAHRELSKERFANKRVLNALESAMGSSMKNMKSMSGKTLIALDTSGSMTQNRISEKSTVTCAEIGSVLGAMADSIFDEAMVVSFDNNLRTLKFNPNQSILANAASVPMTGGGTDIGLPIRYLLDNKIKVDRILYLSDNETQYWSQGSRYSFDRTVTCQALLEQYRREVNPQVWVHCVDLCGYGTVQMSDRKVNLLAGWSEKLFDVLRLREEMGSTLLREIEKIQL